jgi:hypothetical protein
MLRSLPVVVAVGLVVLAGIAHGLWTDRWGVSGERQAAAERLARLPLTIDNWDGEEIIPDPRELARARVVGALVRRYVQRRTGREVSVFLVCGRPGPVSVHSPDICLTGSGYRMLGTPQRRTVPGDPPGGEAECLTAEFAKESVAAGDRQRVYWTWAAAGVWQAPDRPRLVFGRYPNLFKLYVIHRVSRTGEPPADDPYLDFLRALLPELHRCLFPAS